MYQILYHKKEVAPVCTNRSRLDIRFRLRLCSEHLQSVVRRQNQMVEFIYQKQKIGMGLTPHQPAPPTKELATWFLDVPK